MRLLIILSIAGSLALSSPWVSLADEKGGANQKTVSKPSQKETIKPIQYVPPRKGAPAPGLRRGGGTRGMNKSIPLISVLAPDHVGLTLLEQPVLFWFAPTKQNLSYEFSLIADSADTPVVETKLPHLIQPGIQQIRLSDYNAKLLLGERYQWSVALIVDPDEPSSNIVAKGAIERVDRGKLNQPLPNDLSKEDAPMRYAEAGVWYDAVMAISDLIQANPADAELRQQRTSLLEQGGLGEVAASIINIRARSAQ